MAFKFSIGYNGQPGFDKTIAPHLDRISDVYFVAPYTHSARRAMTEAMEFLYGLRLHETLKFLDMHSIRANMLFNAMCIGDMYGARQRFEQLCEQVDFYRDIYHVSAVTVVSAIEGEVIKKQFPDVELHASTNLFIRTPQQAAKIRHFVDVLTPDREINRDLEMLHAVKDVLQKPLRILANEGCIPECPHRVQHLNRVSHERPPFGEFHLPGAAVFRRDPATILKSPIIRPEDLHRYEGIADTIKLATRSSTNRQLDLVLRAYGAERHDGDLFSLMECGCLSVYLQEARDEGGGNGGRVPAFSNGAVPVDFFDHVTSCDRICDNCNYCNTIAKTAFHWADGGVEIRG